jgi:hypothetical protein
VKIANPSEEEIAAACQAIRQSWSRVEHTRRRIGTVGDRIHSRPHVARRHWRPPTIRVTPEIAAALENLKTASIK